MKSYEMIREIFNLCSGNQMRDVSIGEIDAEDLHDVVKSYLTGGTVQCEKSNPSAGVTVFDIVSDGMRQRITFTEL